MIRIDLKKIARVTVMNNNIDSKVKEFVLTKLTRSELREYLMHLKNLTQRNTVTVVGHDITYDLKVRISNIYRGKHIIFVRDTGISEGIKIIDNDTETDFTLENYIDNTVEELKKTI